MELVRAHGLGNDYLVLARNDGPPLIAAQVIAICDRHRGVGGDGILEPTPVRSGHDATYGVRIWNPDGSIAEKSGNGLRIFARWLVDDQGAPASFTVSTGHDVVGCTVGDDDVCVAMGVAKFTKPLVTKLGVDDAILEVVIVDLGNPHCVVFVDDAELDHLPWRAFGAMIENHRAFPNRTNVQFARSTEAGTVDIRIWERGAGETMASGSSSCAVAAAAVRTGRLEPGRITVRMEGGELTVTIGAKTDDVVLLEGPVSVVGRIVLDPRYVSSLD